MWHDKPFGYTDQFLTSSSHQRVRPANAMVHYDWLQTLHSAYLLEHIVDYQDSIRALPP